jgi:hypothetical protein
MEKIKPVKINDYTVIFYLFGEGNNIALYSVSFLKDREPDQIVNDDYLAKQDGKLILYYDIGTPGICLPHWQGYMFIDPEYDSEAMRNELVDYLLNQKIVERPLLVGFTGWDRSGKVQGSVARHADDGQDIFIGSD